MTDSSPSTDSSKRVIPIKADPATAVKREELVSLYKKTEKIYPREVAGWFMKWRWVLVWFTQIIFYGLPWLEWGQRQAVLFDLGAYPGLCPAREADETDTDGATVELLDLFLQHVGYEGDQTRKHHRNLPLLRVRLEQQPDNLFVHMTGMSDLAWQRVKDTGAQVSLAVPIEMNMRHGTPPILKMQSLGIEPSLSIDVECTMTADFFTQMRGMMTMQRMVVNQMVLDPGFATGNWWPTPNGTPPLLNTRDVLRFATMNGAKGLRLDQKTGSLTPGKEADIIILDATRLNVAPLNHVPGTVVSLMDRTNVETVIVAGKVR